MQLNKLIKILTAVLVVMFPVGLLIMLSGDSGKRFIWTTNIFLALQAAITFIFIIGAAEKKSASLTAAIIMSLAFTIELIGVKTGFPFGNYTYTDTLNPALLGVPLAITLSWFTIAVNVYIVARFFLYGAKKIFILAVSAFTILSFDLILEPFASYINGFWIWESTKVPVQNYLSWLISGFIFAYLLDRFVMWNRNVFLNINFITIPAVILLINILQYAVININNGYIIITIIGFLSISASVLFVIKIRKYES